MDKITSTYKTLFKVADSVHLESGVTIPCIAGQCSQVEVVSQNGYRYRKGFWDKVVNDPVVQSKVNGREYLGTIEHPTKDEEYLNTPLDKASHVIMKLWLQDSCPFVTLGLLNNPRGNEIKALVDVGFHPGVSTRGLGDILQDDTSSYVSEEGYAFLGEDIVLTPNFSSLKLSKEPISDSLRANPVFKELCDMHQLKDSADTAYDPKALMDELRGAVAHLQSILEKIR